MHVSFGFSRYLKLTITFTAAFQKSSEKLTRHNWICLSYHFQASQWHRKFFISSQVWCDQCSLVSPPKKHQTLVRYKHLNTTSKRNADLYPRSTVFGWKFQKLFIQLTTAVKFSQLQFQFNVTTKQFVFWTFTNSRTLKMSDKWGYISQFTSNISPPNSFVY